MPLQFCNRLCSTILFCYERNCASNFLKDIVICNSSPFPFPLAMLGCVFPFAWSSILCLTFLSPTNILPFKNRSVMNGMIPSKIVLIQCMMTIYVGSSRSSVPVTYGPWCSVSLVKLLNQGALKCIDYNITICKMLKTGISEVNTSYIFYTVYINQTHQLHYDQYSRSYEMNELRI